MFHKKCAALLLALMLLVPSFALGEEIPSYQPGDTFELVFTVTENPNRAVGATLKLRYDHDVFELIPSSNVQNDAPIISLNILGIPVGEFVPVSFTVRPNAPGGVYEIQILVEQAADINENLVDGLTFSAFQVQVASAQDILAAENEALRQQLEEALRALEEEKARNAQAAEEAAVPGIFLPGTYEAAAQGFGGEIKVVLTVDENAITAIEITGDNETPGLGGAALPLLAEACVGQADADAVDGMSGATITSVAVKEAVAAALSQAKGEALRAPEEKEARSALQAQEAAKADGSSGAAASFESRKVGVSLPTKSLQRWHLDGSYMESMFTEAGCAVDLRYADNDVQQQLNQVANMINNGCKVVIIAAVEGSSLGPALELAKEKGVAVIAYDRLLTESDAVSYYVTFDNYLVGAVQGAYIKDALDLDHAEGPFCMEITAGDPNDNNARTFYRGAMDVLEPYIQAGKLVVKSGQLDFSDVATPTWRPQVAQDRASSILSAFYANGSGIDAWLCSNDSTALGVISALEESYRGAWPVITGQDCDLLNVRKMIEGRQAMSVFKDTRILVAQAFRMAGQIFSGEEVDVNDTETVNNGKITVPSFLCAPVIGSAENYEELLIETGYYSADQLR
ncbi:MAG: substrate-binding domain-containing protein [Clostridia bacterium]|nr:substrate-binding domain-containing protein [Clostridia bacterium]